jgi:hypothetical protein
MPSKNNFRATVFDISKRAIPYSINNLLIDTHIWIWLYYDRIYSCAESPKQYQKIYPEIYKKARLSKGKTFHSIYSLLEIAHIIERSEFEFYCASKLGSDKGEKKVFRHNSDLRLSVAQNIRDVWDSVGDNSDLIEGDMSKDFIKWVYSCLLTEVLDGYDYGIVDSMRKNGITNILTDDIDYVTVDGITVYTANPSISIQARGFGKLLNP